jgi:hypothetical protein
MSETSDWMEGIEGNFLLRKAVVKGEIELSFPINARPS